MDSMLISDFHRENCPFEDLKVLNNMFSSTFTPEIGKWRNEQYIEITHSQMCLLISRQ